VLAATVELSVVVPVTCVELYVVSVAGLIVELVVEDTPAVSVEDL
jgi:hypothetical protein